MMVAYGGTMILEPKQVAQAIRARHFGGLGASLKSSLDWVAMGQWRYEQGVNFKLFCRYM
jgi:hypothetical protein